MGFLKRVLRTPDEDEDEGEDEFSAEENGLFMPSSPPDDARPPEVQADLATPALPAAAEPVVDPVMQASQSAGDPLDMTAESPPVESQVQQPVPAPAPAEQSAGDEDALSLFKASAKEGASDFPLVLKEHLEDISAADLLAEARSVRASLLGSQTAGGE